ncbi:MAG: MFS transporter [Bacteroidales bacterium]|nr:MFS transporter [Bacteroidales bacterium]
MKAKESPWVWVPTLYLFEGLPYAIVNTIALAIFKDMGVDNGTLGPLTTLISLPWLVKPLWSPFMDIFRSKRWWILLTQFTMLATLAVIAFCLPLCSISVLMALFVVVAFASATHDIAADGYYMLALDQRRQSSFVGIRNTFYRGGLVLGQGLLVMLGGILQTRTGDIPKSWGYVLMISAVLLAFISVYHLFILPRPEEDTDKRIEGSYSKVWHEFVEAFRSFFLKKGVWWAIAFLLLFRLPEALSLNLLYPFFKDGTEVGGLGAGTGMYGLVYGTFGVIALLLGGILGGIYASRKGLRASMWPMALALALPCVVYLLMAIFHPTSVWSIGSLIVLDQFGYGFGFTAYTLFMMRFVDGPLKTSHYAICTAFMWLSMKLPALVAGYLQMWLGYVGFFTLVMVSCLGTFAAAAIARGKILPKEETGNN